MRSAELRIQRDGPITCLTLERAGRGNSLSAALVEQLTELVAACHGDGTRALVIDALQPNFCTGFDLSELDGETDDTLLARFVRVELLLQLVARAPFLTAALARGKTWGAGADLFAACTLRWARPDATFAFPGAGFGLVLGSARLGAAVGATRAGDWILSGRQIGVEEAVQTGLVQRCVDGDADLLCAAALTLLERVDAATQARVGAALRSRSESDDALDLARLVQSAAAPGLKERIMAYRARSRPGK